MSALSAFSGERNVDLKEASNRVKRWVRQILALPHETVVTVSEINCRDTKCPGVETAILIMEAEKATRLIKIPCSLNDLHLDDLHAALQ